MDSQNIETIVQELSKNQCRVAPEDFARVAEFLDNAEASVESEAKGGSTNFRAIFVSTFMLLCNIKRTNDTNARKSGVKLPASSGSKNGKLEAASMFEHCKSATVRAAVALFCLPRSLNRDLKLKIIVSYLTNNSADPVLSVCRDTNLQNHYKSFTIPWKSPAEIYETSMINQWMRLSRAILQIADFTEDKNLPLFARNFDKYSYYKNIMFFLKKSSLSSMVIYEPLISMYMKQCVAPIEAPQIKTKLLLQFKISPLDVVNRMLEQLPMSERAPINESATTLTDVKHVTMKSSESSVRPVKSIDESQIQHYKPDRKFNVFVGDPNYQALIGIDNIVTPQGIKRIQKIMHCVYDVIEMLDLQSKQTKSLMHLTWAQRLELVDSHAKIALSEMSGEELLNYKNTTDKPQAITFSCLNDDGLSVSQTIIVKPERTMTKSASKRKASAAAITNSENSTEKLKKPKIESTEL